MDSKEQRYSVSSAHRLNEDNQVESKQSMHNVKEKSLQRFKKYGN